MVGLPLSALDSCPECDLCSTSCYRMKRGQRRGDSCQDPTAPLGIAMSSGATAEQAFRLARLHVQDYLAKPFGLQQLDAAIPHMRSQVRDLEAAGALSVGRLGLVEARNILRDSMVQQALGIAKGKRGEGGPNTWRHQTGCAARSARGCRIGLRRRAGRLMMP